MIYLFVDSLYKSPFVENEFVVFSKLDAELTIIPMFIGNENNKILPSNVKLDRTLVNWKSKIHILFLIQSLLSRDFIFLMFQKQRPLRFKYFIQSISRIYHARMVEWYINTKLKVIDSDVIYSYWLDEIALGIATYLNKCDSKAYFISRAHGGDVYEESRGVYIPYRERVFKRVDKVLSVSQAGADFLKDRYTAYKDKISVSRLGVQKHNVTTNIFKQDNSVISLISCSNVIPVKRVDLIYTSICEYCNANLNKSFRWTHIGGGRDFNFLKEMVCNSPSNLAVELIGAVDPIIVTEMMQAKRYDIFFNLSTSEGVPVSIMEVLSFNIPVVATNAGGNCEIVNSETGCLIPIDFEISEFCTAIDLCLDNAAKLKITIASFFESNYCANKNYIEFYKIIFDRNEKR